MELFDELKETVRRLRAEDGCPWDREQTHTSLKPAVIEEAAEVICGINVYEHTGNCENLKEELGDLLLQIVMHCQIAEEEAHVFGDKKVSGSKEVLENWEEIKLKEKEGKEDVGLFLPQAFDEAEDLISRARIRKGL